MKDRGKLSGRVALITGAASGIGRAVASVFAGEGAQVILADLDSPGAEKAVAELKALGADAWATALDVTSEASWMSVIDRVLEACEKLDILVGSAGIADEASITELSLEQWRRVHSVNLDGAFIGLKTTLPVMRRAGRGVVIHVASLSGLKPAPGAAAYCSSKAALIRLTEVAAAECRDSRIRINAVAPGGVKTPMWQKTPMWPEISQSAEWTAGPEAPPAGRFAEPEEIARAVLFLSSDDASYINGTALTLDGGAP
ncbi:MAG: SDR family NAD(P)-dependent oxidoreductase [Planctomycetota bacterium]